MLNPVWLQTFLALVRQRSFQAAADDLGIAQPTVSQHLRKLEDQLGVILIARGRAGCELTGEAVAFLPHAESLMRLNEQALAAIRSLKLRVGASSNIGIYILPPYLRSFLERRDPADFDLLIDRNPAIAGKLESGELDMAVMEWWDGRPGFQAQSWKSEAVVAIVPPDHPLAVRSCLSRESLQGFELLGGEPGTGTGRLLNAWFGGADRVPRISRRLGSTEAVKQVVKAGLGISLVLASAVTEEVRSGSLRAIRLQDPPLHKDLFVIWRSGDRRQPVPALAGHLLGTCRALPA